MICKAGNMAAPVNIKVSFSVAVFEHSPCLAYGRSFSVSLLLWRRPEASDDWHQLELRMTQRSWRWQAQVPWLSAAPGLHKQPKQRVCCKFANVSRGALISCIKRTENSERMREHNTAWEIIYKLPARVVQSRWITCQQETWHSLSLRRRSRLRTLLKRHCRAQALFWEGRLHLKVMFLDVATGNSQSRDAHKNTASTAAVIESADLCESLASFMAFLD